MTQNITDTRTIETPEATVRFSDEVDEYWDEPQEIEVDNARIRENGWIDVWSNGEQPYRQSIPPHAVYRIDWADVEE